MQCAARASNGPNHLGLCALQDPLWKEKRDKQIAKGSGVSSLAPNEDISRNLR